MGRFVKRRFPRFFLGHWVWVFAACSLMATDLSAEPAGFVLVANKSNPTQVLSRQLVSRIFLKKTKSWEYGARVVPVDQKSSEKVRAEFSKSVMGKSVAAMKSYWQQQIFSGRSVPPKELSGDSAVLAFVAANPGAIGYVSKAADLSNVAVISIRQK